MRGFWTVIDCAGGVARARTGAGMAEQVTIATHRRRNRVEAAILAVAGAVCLGGAAWAAVRGTLAGPLWLTLPVGAGSLALAVWMHRQAGRQGPALILDAEGFEDRRGTLGKIAWRDVERIELVQPGTLHGPRMFRVTLKQDAPVAGIGLLKGREVALFTYDLADGMETLTREIPRLAPQVPRRGF